MLGSSGALTVALNSLVISDLAGNLREIVKVIRTLERRTTGSRSATCVTMFRGESQEVLDDLFGNPASIPRCSWLPTKARTRSMSPGAGKESHRPESWSEARCSPHGGGRFKRTPAILKSYPVPDARCRARQDPGCGDGRHQPDVRITATSPGRIAVWLSWISMLPSPWHLQNSCNRCSESIPLHTLDPRGSGDISLNNNPGKKEKGGEKKKRKKKGKEMSPLGPRGGRACGRIDSVSIGCTVLQVSMGTAHADTLSQKPIRRGT